MLKIAKTEFYKLKRYSVVWIGVATMLTVVLLTRFMATASDGAVHTLEYFSNSVIWNNFSLIFPATITLIAGYIIERERVDDTLKNILTIPIPFRKLLAGKLIAVGGLAIILAAIEFVFTMIIFFISRFPGFSFAGMILALVRMIGMNLFVYVAVLPIIVFTGQRAGSFMAGVGFSFFYGFVGTFASGHGLGNIYPVTAGLGLLLLAETGFRIGELLGVRYGEDIDYKNHVIYVNFREDNENNARAKNAEFRRAKISDATFDILTFYIEEYKELILKQEYLFINVSGDYAGKPFKVSGVYAMLRRLEEKTGIKASPHMLRHYFANERRKDGWKLELISQALGHRNIETTMKYLNITDEELIQVSDEFYSKHQAMYGIQDLL